jgi:polysaccharide export outer membrane protein
VRNKPGKPNGTAISTSRRACVTAALAMSAIGLMAAQSPTLASQANNAATPPATVAVPAGIPTPADYVIGPNDVLTVVFWRDKDISGDVVVRPDGRISVPLINDVQASGLTPEQLRQQITSAAAKFVEDPTVSVVVKAINSRKVFITGQVGKPGEYPLSGPTTVLQLLAVAGGVHEFADSKNITIVRAENGRTVAYPFNYKEVLKRKNLKQNIELKPGDTVVVP